MKKAAEIKRFARKSGTMTSPKEKRLLKVTHIDLNTIQKDYLHLNPDGKTIAFNSFAAIAFGINAAIVLNHILYWYLKNEADLKNYVDNRFWTYDSISTMYKKLPIMSERAYRLAIHKLLKSGIVYKSERNLNKAKYDKTSWYTVDEARFVAFFGFKVGDYFKKRI